VPRIFTDAEQAEIGSLEKQLSDEDDICYLEYVKTSRININIRQVPQITAGQSGCDTQPDVPTLTCAPGAHVRKNILIMLKFFGGCSPTRAHQQRCYAIKAQQAAPMELNVVPVQARADGSSSSQVAEAKPNVGPSRCFTCPTRILVRLDVEDLLRCKSVCKSWKTLISDRHFIKAHQNHCFNNNDNGQAMIDQVILPFYYGRVGQKYQIVGSSNGLVCINTFHGNEFSVANPWTREERIVQKHLPSQESCWGFGYDPVTNDYKIVFGVTEGMYQTSFQVLSLKSNVWKYIGHVNGICPHGELATLCNGALHWLMDPDDQENSSFIISFDLSKEVFKEDSNLMIKKYNVKESWEPLGSNFQKTNECIRYSRIGVPDIEWSNHDTWHLTSFNGRKLSYKNKKSFNGRNSVTRNIEVLRWKGNALQTELQLKKTLLLQKKK
ncbi:putative F-box domain-containing protein, partial [Tanacetum coccineum]